MATAAAAQDDGAVGDVRLREALRLSAEQQDAWKVYAAAVAPDPRAQARHEAADMLLPQLTTPRRIALIEATTMADATDLHRQGEAVKAFYAGLSPDQQRTFDRETAQPAPGQAAP